MAGTSQNGWPKDPPVVRIYAGGDVSGAEVRAGDVATVMQWFLDSYHRTVEPIREVHGYRSSAFNASIPGSISNSDHVSATAVDVNGADHPNEAVRRAGWSSGYTGDEIRRVRDLLAAAGGCLQWGLDFPVGARDAMHFAVARGVTPQQLASLAGSIRAQQQKGTDVDLNNPNDRKAMKLLLAETMAENIGNANGGPAAWWRTSLKSIVAETIREAIGDKAPDGSWGRTAGTAMVDAAKAGTTAIKTDTAVIKGGVATLLERGATAGGAIALTDADVDTIADRVAARLYNGPEGA